MKIQFEKYTDGLVPTIIQDATTKTVLMLGFMNEEAYNKTMDMTPFGGSAEGEGITVGLLEAIDLYLPEISDCILFNLIVFKIVLWIKKKSYECFILRNFADSKSL